MSDTGRADALLSDAVENLVTQFSSPLDFYRELVQNSIDAGSSAIDVWLEFLPGEGLEGTMAIHVDDYGEGMTEAIIDDQLTQLFSSSKEDDHTKIGKFGIGFVSVFALRPAGVLVHTGRDGEFWEVFFHEDRSFTKTRVDQPIDGTQITLFVPGDRSRYRELVEDSRRTLEKWCAHSDTEINFEDRTPTNGLARGPAPINAEFRVQGDCAITVEREGFELAAAYSTSPLYGFYNKGLALAVTSAAQDVLDARANRYRFVTFKLKSRWLEHTLSRETVMRDENFEKAMNTVDAVAARELRDALFDALESLAATPKWGLPEHHAYQRLARYLEAEPTEAIDAIGPRRIFRTLDQKARTLDELLVNVAREGRLYVSATSTSLTSALLEDGTPVLATSIAQGGPMRGDPMLTILATALERRDSRGIIGTVRARLGVDHLARAWARLQWPEEALVHVDLDEAPGSQVRALLGETQAALAAAGAPYRSLHAGRIEGDSDAPRLFALGRRIAPIMELPPAGQYERGMLERPVAVVNVHHPHVRSWIALSASHPVHAVYCLAQALLLEEDHGPEHGERMLKQLTAGLTPAGIA